MVKLPVKARPVEMARSQREVWAEGEKPGPGIQAGKTPVRVN